MTDAEPTPPRPGNELRALFGSRPPEPHRFCEPLVMGVRDRAHQSLNGTWKAIVDQLDIGMTSAIASGIGTATADPAPNEVREHNFAGGYDLAVPGDWNTQEPELFWYRGVVWYQRRFDHQPVDGRRSILWFGAVNLGADVFCNGHALVSHKGGFTPFCVDATDVLVAGDNLITIRVNSMSGPGDVPTERNDWMNYGGITRDVLLVDVPDRHVRSWSLHLDQQRPGRIVGWVDVMDSGPSAPIGAPAGTEATVKIGALGVDLIVAVEADGRAPIDIEAAPELWSPSSPLLYEVEITAGDDRVRDQIGFRTIEVSGADIVLNGEPVFLHGISMHEESVLHAGRANTPADADAAIELIRGLGCNFVRLAHYPHNELMVRACDRAGLLVWAEVPVYHGIDFGAENALTAARSQIREVIDRDRNRASVILWSVANETPSTDDRNQFLQTMVADVRDHDPTRLVTAALLGFAGMKAISEHAAARLRGETPESMPATMVDDPLGEHLDVIGWNQYIGWYVPNFLGRRPDADQAELRRVILEDLPEFGLDNVWGKPMIVSEVGAGALQGKHGAEDEAWSEELQAQIYEREIAMLLNNAPPVAGISPWILKDFRAPYRLNTEFQSYWNRKGLVGIDGQPKLAYDVLRRLYTEHGA